MMIFNNMKNLIKKNIKRKKNIIIIIQQIIFLEKNINHYLNMKKNLKENKN